MFDWVTSTFGKYKKSLGVTALTVSSIVGVGYLCKYKLAIYQQTQLDSYLYKGQLQNHSLRHTQTCLSTLLEYFDTLLPNINSTSNTEQLIKDIKEGTVAKKSGWNDLKILSVVKIFTTLYSTTLLTIFVSIQLTIISSALYKTNVNADEAFDMNTQSMHSKYLHLITEIIKSISNDMKEVCTKSVEEVFNEVSLTQTVDYFTANEMIATVNDLILDKMVDVKLDKFFMIQFENKSSNDDMAVFLEQTKDIIGSTDFSHVFTEFVQHNQLFVRELLYDNLKDKESIVVAKLIPILSKIPTKLLCDLKFEYLEHALGFSVLKQFQGNIYEGLTSS